jgi:hypothetical protein
MSNDAVLIEAINQTPFLNPGDKSFLMEKVPQLSPLEKLRLRQSLGAGMAPPVLQQLQIMRARFYQEEAPKKPDPITQVLNNILPPKPKRILSQSILTQPALLGAPAPQAIRDDSIGQLKTLNDYYHPAQLNQLRSQHITFGINDNADQIMHSFLTKLTQTLEKTDNINVRRGYFMSFLQSSLFSSYLNTGLTALRHPELEPPKIILNLLYQINNNYLNNKQFQHAAKVCGHLRSLCGI